MGNIRQLVSDSEKYSKVSLTSCRLNSSSSLKLQFSEDLGLQSDCSSCQERCNEQSTQVVLNEQWAEKNAWSKSLCAVTDICKPKHSSLNIHELSYSWFMTKWPQEQNHIVWLYCPLLFNLYTAQLRKFWWAPLAFVIKEEETIN